MSPDRTERMKDRIEQLSLEPWNNEAELADTYSQLVNRYASMELDELQEHRTEAYHCAAESLAYVDDDELSTAIEAMLRAKNETYAVDDITEAVETAETVRKYLEEL